MAKRNRRTKHRAPNTGQEPEQPFSDPRLSWLATHRLPAEQPDIKRPQTILATEQALWGLEFEFYVTPLLNRTAWQAYREAVELILDQGLDPETEIPKPKCGIPIGWIKESRALTDSMIGTLTLPRMDEVTDRFVCTDWEELAAWKADVEVAASKLIGRERQVYRGLQAGLTIGEIAKRMALPITEVINAVRTMNGRLRAQLRIA